MSEITKEDAYLRFNKELMKTVRVVAAVIKTVNENDEPIIFLDDCDAHLAEAFLNMLQEFCTLYWIYGSRGKDAYREI